MSEYTSKGQGALNTVLGAIGTAGATGVLNGGLGGIFGGCGNGYGWNGGCSDNIPVNRYEAGKDAEIARLETELKLRDANFYALGEVNKVRDYFENRLAVVENQLADQRVYNATNTAVIGCVQNQVNALMGLTKMVIPNGNVCPGWGDVTVSVTPASTT